jgi:hypothetical protein
MKDNRVSKLWQCLEAIGAPGAVTAEWQAWTGTEFGAFKTAFLQKAPGLAMSYPCPRECGCAHEVVPHDDGSGVAVCMCDPSSCDDFPVSADDRVIYRLNPAKLGQAIAKAFGCDARTAEFGLPRTWQVAAFGNSALPVVLTLQPDAAAFAGVVRQLIGQRGERFILLAPTSRFLDGNSQAALKAARAGVFDLEFHVTFLANGSLQARKSGGELFSPFLPENETAATDSEVAGIFAIWKRLDTGSKARKAPLETVFRMLVLEERTQAYVARQCHCVEGLISLRVGQIEKKMKRPLRELKNFKTRLGEMNTAIEEPRARRIYRKGLTDDTGEDNDEM